jgi:hypothetical protein
LCVACGYNLKTGQKLSAVVVVAETDEDEGDKQPDSAPATAADTKPPK